MDPVRSMIVLAASLTLVGCASSSTIQPASKSKSAFSGAAYKGEEKVVSEDSTGAERYRVFEQGATGFVSLQTVREAAEHRANAYCEKQGKWAKTLTEHTSKPPHILGNFPRAELVFICAERISTPATPEGEPAGFQDELFIKLTNLKKLLDSGVITQEEFEQEKAKLLREQ